MSLLLSSSTRTLLAGPLRYRLMASSSQTTSNYCSAPWTSMLSQSSTKLKLAIKMRESVSWRKIFRVTLKLWRFNRRVRSRLTMMLSHWSVRLPKLTKKHSWRLTEMKHLVKKQQRMSSWTSAWVLSSHSVLSQKNKLWTCSSMSLAWPLTN